MVMMHWCVDVIVAIWILVMRVEVYNSREEIDADLANDGDDDEIEM